MLCAAAAVILALNLFGGNATAPGAPSPPHAPPGAAALAASAAPDTSTSAPSAEDEAAESPLGKHLPRSRPVRLLIPKISVDAPFTDLVIGPSGRLEPPPANDVNLVGWHVAGASPGETGTAIIAGHVDTKTSPAVFAGLSELVKGDTFSVRRADGRTATFRVDTAETFAKDDFPSERVYADTAQAQVRLITCAGSYDRTVKDYTDNLVVFAHLI
ncbi:class F sortase [Streptomyces sp. NY05-11A]|uniref:class F sortase n=1 Tax=Streptomyces soliscabiei TaxID=588897 RepID=UPI0029BC7A8A|nr:class F sortase [Streptomyces sp. NY05-11A]MDX2681582.1 class F sortase [Streptomyces sp. NY05-11A]